MAMAERQQRREMSCSCKRLLQMGRKHSVLTPNISLEAGKIAALSSKSINFTAIKFSGRILFSSQIDLSRLKEFLFSLQAD